MPVEVADTNSSFRFRVASVTKPIVLVEGLFQAVHSCDLQDWRVLRWISSGPTLTLHRRRRARIQAMSKHKKEPIHPIDWCNQCWSLCQSSKKNRGNRELLRETDGDTLADQIRSDQKRQCVLSKMQLVLKSSRTDALDDEMRDINDVFE